MGERLAHDYALAYSKAAVQGLQMLLDDVICQQCGCTVEVENCRVKSKVEGTYMCKTCDSKLTILWRGFGAWPPSSWSGMSIDLQQQFFRDIKDKPAAEIRAIATDKVFGREVHASSYALGGRYLPLNVWAQTGYPAEMNEQHTAERDRRVCPVVGLPFRLPIFSQELTGSRIKGP